MSLSKNLHIAFSICTLDIVTLDDVDTIVTTTDKYHVTVNLKSGKSWTSVYFTPGTAELSEKLKETDAGILSEQVFKISYPGIDESNLLSFDPFLDRPILARFTFSHGGKFLFGNIGNPAKLTISSQISSKSSGHVIEMNWSSPHRYLVITS